ncbi:hypothetical protein SDC9_212339 [bioreactor metagenome]|uniref:Uncharacterized protein n=1 Tax=bioreactor metagenome TaxID=1076179 RepID=A0A645JYJ6_9ZZZZ
MYDLYLLPDRLLKVPHVRADESGCVEFCVYLVAFPEGGQGIHGHPSGAAEPQADENNL